MRLAHIIKRYTNVLRVYLLYLLIAQLRTLRKRLTTNMVKYYRRELTCVEKVGKFRHMTGASEQR